MSRQARTILGAPRNAPIDALFGELGWRPVWARAVTQAATYWVRVTELPKTSLPRLALEPQRTLFVAGKPCWLLHYRRQAHGVPFAKNCWNNWWAQGNDPSFLVATSRVERGRNEEDTVVHVPWKEPLREAFIETADLQWRDRVQSALPSQIGGLRGGNKLRTYARFKASVCQEAYLQVNMRYQARRLLCCFRIGVAPLQVKLGPAMYVEVAVRMRSTSP